jgi:hypothetical protein
VSKVISIIAFPAGQDRTAHRRELLEQARGRGGHVAVNLVDVDVGVDAGQGAPQPYDVVIEEWGVAADGWKPPPLPSGTAVHAYHVAERIELDEPLAPEPGGRSPGVKAVYLVRRKAGLSDAEAAARWRAHAPVARQHHVGMCRYVQNGVVRALTPGAPVYHGIAVLHFPTLEDLQQRMYGSEEGRQAIARDVSGLVEESLALYTSEYVLGR